MYSTIPIRSIHKKNSLLWFHAFSGTGAGKQERVSRGGLGLDHSSRAVTRGLVGRLFLPPRCIATVRILSSKHKSLQALRERPVSPSTLNVLSLPILAISLAIGPVKKRGATGPESIFTGKHVIENSSLRDRSYSKKSQESATRKATCRCRFYTSSVPQEELLTIDDCTDRQTLNRFRCNRRKRF